MLDKTFNLNKNQLVDKYNLGEYLRNSILSLKSDNFKIFKTFYKKSKSTY